MKLAEYEREIEQGERGELTDAPGHEGATATAFRLLAREIRGAAWRPRYRHEAERLAARAEALGVED